MHIVLTVQSRVRKTSQQNIVDCCTLLSAGSCLQFSDPKNNLTQTLTNVILSYKSLVSMSHDSIFRYTNSMEQSPS
jgi:hypothetical protein